MKKYIFSIGLLLAIVAFICAALYWSGNDIVYMFAYIFSFAFLSCYTIFSASTIMEKIVQVIIYALILAAQILFAIFMIRSVVGTEQTIALCRLVGVLIVFVPFLVRQIWRSYV